MAYPQPMESMAYNRWIYGHIDLYEQKANEYLYKSIFQ